MKKYFLILLAACSLTICTPRVFAVSPPNNTPASSPTTGCQSGPDGYCLLAPGIPGIDNGSGKADIASYIPNFIKAVIGLATGLAVLLVIYGGAEYIMSGSFGNKKDGKETIMNALLGLVLLSVSWIILYTLNPKLVQFSLNLDNVGSNAPIDTSLPNTDGGTGTSGTGGTGGTTSNTCTNCTPVSVIIPAKKASEGGCAGTGPCEIDATLASKLQQLALDTQNISWWVTEMYPPADPNHVSSCHQNGTCVDAALKDTNSSPSTVAAFLTKIKSDVGSSFLYEAPNCARATQLQTAPELSSFKSQIKVCKSTTGENVHINLSGASGGSCGTAADGSSNEISCS